MKVFIWCPDVYHVYSRHGKVVFQDSAFLANHGTTRHVLWDSSQTSLNPCHVHRQMIPINMILGGVGIYNLKFMLVPLLET